MGSEGLPLCQSCPSPAACLRPVQKPESCACAHPGGEAVCQWEGSHLRTHHAFVGPFGLYTCSRPCQVALCSPVNTLRPRSSVILSPMPQVLQLGWDLPLPALLTYNLAFICKH